MIEVSSLQKIVRVLLFLFLLIAGLIYAKPFLVPVVFAALLAMLFLPISNWLERKGIHRALTALICILILAAVVAGIIWLFIWQLSDLAKDADQIEQNLLKKQKEFSKFLGETFGISVQKQQEVLKDQQGSTTGKLGDSITRILRGVGGFLTNFLLVLVYIFLFLYYRLHLKKFILLLVKKDDREASGEIMHSAEKVIQKYLTGLALMIVGLWIMYSIGFSMVGVKNAIFFAILCGLLEIVPFVGNLVGNLITIITTLAQGGSMNMIVGILITYALVQFIQTYFLEPLVVGAEVNINPLFTIAGIVVGELIWGIAGMIVAIPLLGFAKIICDHVESLKPYGYLMGDERKKPKRSFRKKIKSPVSQ
ncbi:MAG: AI-2E family transporter [Chitinophagaceae bacterium]